MNIRTHFVKLIVAAKHLDEEEAETLQLIYEIL